MDKIKFEDVFKSYNGRSGCMCGCLGNYKLPSHTSIEEANRSVGWAAYSEEDKSDRSVKIAVRKINEAIDKYGSLSKAEQERNNFYVCLEGSTKFISVDISGRNTTVYLK